MIKLKRVYESASSEDGLRILVERLWPRGIKKSALKIDSWLKDVAPSDALRRWFSHDPRKWIAFRERYFKELDRNPEVGRGLADSARHGPVTLIYSSRDTERNNAVALKDFLSGKLRRKSVSGDKTPRRGRSGTNPPLVVAHIRAIGIDLEQDTRTNIQRRLDRTLGKFASSIERVSVRLRDVNGPRGGVDQACRIKVVLRNLPSIVFETQDAFLDVAVGAALAGVERSVRRTLQRRRSKPIKKHATPAVL